MVVNDERNLGLKESAWVNYKNAICVELCLKLWFGSQSIKTGIFIILLIQDGFKGDSPDNHLVNSFKSSRTQMFFIIGIFQKFRNRKHLYWSLFLTKLNISVFLSIFQNFWEQLFFSLRISRYSEKVVEKRWRRKAIKKRYIFQANTKSL